MEPIKGVAGDHDAPEANAAAVVTYAANTRRRHVVHQLIFSYDAAPTGGSITVTDGGTTIFEADIIAGGPDEITFTPPLMGSYNSAVVATLAAGGASVSGKLTVRHDTY